MFYELYELLLECISSYPYNLKNISEIIFNLLHFGSFFKFEGITYEIFCSIIFIYSGLQINNYQCETIWKILIQILSKQDLELFANNFQDLISSEPYSNHAIYQQRFEFIKSLVK
jgi:hypothetical protein